MNNIELLQQNPVFAELSEAELEAVNAISHEKNYEKNEVVFAHHQPPTFMYIVIEGVFILDLPSKDNKVLEKGELFGEIGVINNNYRLGSVRTLETGRVLAICGKKMFDKKTLAPEIALKIVHSLAARFTHFLRMRPEISTRELISEGENEYVEFKSTLRMNTHTKRPDKAIELAALKTIAAFLNTNGGTLLIGVNDNQEIIGLKADNFPNIDKILLHLNKMIKARIGTLHVDFVHIVVEHFEEGDVLRVDCEAGTMPAYVDDSSKEYFFIRTGPATTNLRTSKIFDYIWRRFHNKTPLEDVDFLEVEEEKELNQ